MENPILAFRQSKGWTRKEFQKRSGITCQTLKNLETGETKKISLQTLEFLSFAGLGSDIQERLNEWREIQEQNRRHLFIEGKDSYQILKCPL